MANENNGVFSDLFNAVGNLLQNVADTLGNLLSSATPIVESCTTLCGTIVSNTANTAVQLIQSIATGVTSVLTPKK